MAKRDQRWPIWKIVATMLGFAAAAVGLFIGAHYVGTRGTPPGQPADPSGAAAHYSMSNMLTLLGALSTAMVPVCMGWLVVRYYQSIPAWKKRAKLPAYRRK